MDAKPADCDKRDPLSLFLRVVKGKRRKQRKLPRWSSIEGEESIVRFRVVEPHRIRIKLDVRRETEWNRRLRASTHISKLLIHQTNRK